VVDACFIAFVESSGFPLDDEFSVTGDVRRQIKRLQSRFEIEGDYG